jgi:hypothetical protein
MENKLELNQYYSFKEISEAYPDKWVILTDVKEKDGEVVRCKLLGICTHSELIENRQPFIDKHIPIACMRTTINMPNMGVMGL